MSNSIALLIKTLRRKFIKINRREMKYCKLERIYIPVSIAAFVGVQLICMVWIQKVISNEQARNLDTRLRVEHTCPINSTKKSCQRLKFSEKALPRTALFSYPGSGNTWVRHLIQQITGFYTGSIYKDTALKKSSFPGEGHAGDDVIVIKTHNRQSLTELYDRTIVVMRNPLNALFASFQQGYNGHVGIISEDQLRQNEKMKKDLSESINDNRVEYGLSSWFLDNLLALQQYRYTNMLIVHYENLQSNLRRELLRISNFLNITVNETVLDCTICNSEGNFHRKKRTFNPYTKQETETIALHVKAMNETLRVTCGLSCTLPYSNITNSL